MQSPHTPAPTEHFEALIDLLRREEAIYAELSLLLDSEHAAMLDMDLSRLGELASRKETLALGIKALDESRKVLARRLAAQFALAPDDVTVTRLCAHTPAALAEPLRAAGARLREIVSACQEKNAHNAHAARCGLDLVNGVLAGLIAQADPAGKVYQPAPRTARGYATLSRTSGSGLISRRA